VEVGGFYPNGAREELLGAHEEVGGDQLPVEPMGFTGKEADEEVGLTYFGERYLVQRIGRWATPDPAEVHGNEGGEGLNSFHYVAGNLLQATDPLGLQPRAPRGPITGVRIDEPIFPDSGRPLDQQRRNSSTSRQVGPRQRFGHEWIPEVIEYMRAPPRQVLSRLDTRSNTITARAYQYRPGIFVFELQGRDRSSTRVAVGAHEMLRGAIRDVHRQEGRSDLLHSHHLNQSALFGRMNRATSTATPVTVEEHLQWHRSMNEGMKAFGRGGSRRGEDFTVAEYNDLARKSYESIGRGGREVDFLMGVTRAEQVRNGYRDGDVLSLPENVQPGPRADRASQSSSAPVRDKQ
jgi:RHS repeat-associated protein